MAANSWASLGGYKFRRQFMIEPYIVDFVCLEDAGLIVDANGGQHAEQRVYDARRPVALESMDYAILRFWNHQILIELNSVLE